MKEKERRFSNFNLKGSTEELYEKQKKSYGYLILPAGIKTFTVEDKARSAKLDFLPYIVTDDKHPQRNDKTGVAVTGNPWFRRPFWVHRNVGADDLTVVCPKSISKPCPICEYGMKRFKEGAPKEETVPLLAKERSLYIVIPIDSDKFEEVPYIWDMSDKLFYDELHDTLVENPDCRMFWWIEKGKTADVRFKWEKLGKNTFPEARNIEFEDRDDYDESIFDEIPSLDNVLKVLSYKELQAIFLELSDEDMIEDAPAEEEKVTTRSRTRRVPDDKPEPQHKEAIRASRRRPEPEPEPEPKPEPEPEPRPARVRGSRGETAKPDHGGTVKDRCPFDHRFGKDTDKFADCNNCKLWNDCADEYDKNK
jgi:hypothetical protein